MATRENVEEVKSFLSFHCRETDIKVALQHFGGNVEDCVSYHEHLLASYRTSGNLHMLGSFLGDKPAEPNFEDEEEVGKRDCFISPDDVIVSIHVGPPEDVDPSSLKIYKVHQGILCRSSKFFQSKAKTEWTKGNAVVKLSYMCVELFAVYVDWLYSRKIMPNGKKLWYGGVHADADDWAILARALVLGSSVMDKAFHDSVLDTMVGIAQAEAASEILKGAKLHIPVQIVFGSVPDDSGARSLLVDIFKRHAGILSSCNDEEFPAAFLRTLASEVMEGTEGLEERLSQNKCWYHKHGEGEICGSTTAELHEVARFLP